MSFPEQPDTAPGERAQRRGKRQGANGGRGSMSRKRQQKNARKVAKRQRSTPSKPWVSPPQQTRPAIKISEAILILAEPLRAHYREPHRMQVIISLAVM